MTGAELKEGEWDMSITVAKLEEDMKTFKIGEIVHFGRPHKNVSGRVTLVESDHVQVKMITGPDAGQYRYFIPSKDIK
jgi:hypothetical protein